ncbi:hypothetical protein J1C56_16820 [Aminobacter anthyllidis]|uniref:Uncharacterized protein n=1 Tax=Aminobacter anthyllidis TaxID=1035067 RepID=A0A9X1D6N7_9HYPH|nr:hypothetical protein [Aminobacter anthyllidis]
MPDNELAILSGSIIDARQSWEKPGRSRIWKLDTTASGTAVELEERA